MEKKKEDIQGPAAPSQKSAKAYFLALRVFLVLRVFFVVRFFVVRFFAAMCLTSLPGSLVDG